MSEEQEKVVANIQPEEPKKDEPKKEEAPKVEVKEEKKKGGHGLMKFGCFIFFVLALVAAGFGYFRYYYVVADGVKAGNLNYITRKGYVFKTFEGRLIQEGIKSGNAQGTIQNNEFIFSVSDDRLFKTMELLTNQQLQLHYNEFLHSLPWRGYSEFVVDSIISINNIPYNEFMAKYQQNGTIVAPQPVSTPSNVDTNNNSEVVTMEQAVKQLQQAQEQLNKAQEQLQRLQQQQNGGNNVNNTPSNNQRRYQSPNNSGNNNYNNTNRTDDGNVFNQ